MVTGAAGSIGSAVTPQLTCRWDVRRTDLHPGDGVDELDVTDADACVAAFHGADAVVHLAAVPDPAATWEQLLAPNVIGTHQAARAAAICGVRRLVLAGSVHAVSAVPEQTQVRAGDPPRPANLYGATKAWAEAVGAWIAATTPTSVVALRIGHFARHQPTEDAVPAGERSAWLSHRDAAELIRAAVEAEGIDFVVAHGISANRYRRVDLQQTMYALGYRPVDDAWS